MLRAGLIDAPRYLKLLATTISSVAGVARARLVQSVADASFDAWVKYYRADENTPNATISYYAKGSLVALAFDLTLRGEGSGSLDDVMRRLWQRSDGGPIDEADIAAALEAVGGRSYAARARGLGARHRRAAAGGAAAALRRRDSKRSRRRSRSASAFASARARSPASRSRHVLRDGAGERAGLAPGDELIGVDGWRLRRLDDASRVLPHEGTTTLARRPRPARARACRSPSPRSPPRTRAPLQLKPVEKADAAARRLREAWIGS